MGFFITLEKALKSSVAVLQSVQLLFLGIRLIRATLRIQVNN